MRVAINLALVSALFASAIVALTLVSTDHGMWLLTELLGDNVKRHKVKGYGGGDAVVKAGVSVAGGRAGAAAGAVAGATGAGRGNLGGLGSGLGGIGSLLAGRLKPVAGVVG